MATNPPSVPPETTILFDNTSPLVDQLFMRSFGGQGAALKTLVIDDPAIAPIPLPAAAWLLLGGVGALPHLEPHRAKAPSMSPKTMMPRPAMALCLAGIAAASVARAEATVEPLDTCFVARRSAPPSSAPASCASLSPGRDGEPLASRSGRPAAARISA